MIEATFQRPMRGKLAIVFDDGKLKDATPQDLEQFDYAERRGVYEDVLNLLLGITNMTEEEFYRDEHLNSLRYALERTICYGPDDDLAIDFGTGSEDSDVIEQANCLLVGSRRCK